jgi:predicted Zn finger-like uncharacterized protein
MPIRLTCPSCSATLSVKDEFAGRAVKCPKCANVIPPSQPAPASPPAAPAAPPTDASGPPGPAKAAPAAPRTPSSEDLDPPAKPAKGRTADRSKDGDNDDRPPRKDRDRDDDDEKPRKRSPERDEDDDRPRRKDRDRDEDDDRPAKRKRRDDEDDSDDDRPRRKQKSGGGGAMIALIICGTLLLICGGIGFSVWYFVYRIKEGVTQLIETTNPRVSQPGYFRLLVGTMTRTKVEETLGGGKVAGTADLEKVFAGDAARIGAWTPMAEKGRAVYWRNGDDYIIAAFNPSAEGESRLQMKEWRPKLGAPAQDGTLDDERFVKDFPPNKNEPGVPLPKADKADPGPAPKADKPQEADKTGPITLISAGDLIDDYKDDAAEADKAFLGQRLLITGTFERLENPYIAYVNARGRATSIRVMFLDGMQNQLKQYKSGDTIKFRCMLVSGRGAAIDVNRGWLAK